MRRLLNCVIPLVLLGFALALLSAPATAAAPGSDVEVMIAVDTSGSMRGALDAAKAAANEFVDSMPVDVRIGVETFGDNVNVLTSPTTDRELLVTVINGIVAGGNTALYDAVVTAGQQFTSSTESRVLVLLSDGKDDGSVATLDEAIAAVQGEHVEAISLTTAETDINSLSALGTVTSADDPAGVSAAFARVASLLAVVVQPAAPVDTATAATTIAAPAAVATTTPASTTAQATRTTVESRQPAPANVIPLVTAGSSDSSAQLWVGAIGIFVGLFLVGLLLFPRNRVSKARLGIDKPRSVAEMGQRRMSAVDEALERHGRRADLATALAVAGIGMQPGEFVSVVGVVAVVSVLLGFLMGGPFLGLVFATVVCLGARFYVHRKKAKRQATFADQLPDVLQLVTTALRSGYGLTQALASVAEEADEPARSEFAHVLVESRLGRDLSDAMRSLAQRMDSEDLAWVVAAIDINRDTGGNLTEILNTVSGTIRERQRMFRQVRTLTAEGRTSARILTVMPLVMVLWQWRANPDNFALLTRGGGLVALVIAGILIIVGTAWVHRIVNSLAL